MMNAEIASEITKSRSQTASTGQERVTETGAAGKVSIAILDWPSFPTADILF